MRRGPRLIAPGSEGPREVAAAGLNRRRNPRRARALWPEAIDILAAGDEAANAAANQADATQNHAETERGARGREPAVAARAGGVTDPGADRGPAEQTEPHPLQRSTGAIGRRVAGHVRGVDGGARAGHPEDALAVGRGAHGHLPAVGEPGHRVAGCGPWLQADDGVLVNAAGGNDRDGGNPASAPERSSHVAST